MKKLFKVTKISAIDYDDYDSCVIVADDVEEVNYLIDEKQNCFDTRGFNIGYYDYGINDRKIEEINLETVDSMELCASFNAG